MRWLVMAVIGIAASWIPALRASRVEPVVTVRA
jgi:ABC-type lipoprotein release transport system permease subunit